MTGSLGKSEIERLLAAWCNGTLEAQDRERLEAALRFDPEARRLYLQYAAVEAELRSLNAGSAWSGGVLEEAIDTRATNEASLQASPKRSQRTGARLYSRLATAAALVGVLATLGWLGRGLGDRRLADAEGRGDAVVAKPVVVARVTATRNCRWSGDSAQIGYGTELTAEQVLDLDAGLAEITFQSGARVLLEGPARLELDAESQSVLREGRLAATLPSGASATPVRTPRLGVAITPASSRGGLDAGWHFGLAADTTGGDEVHVFRGEVETYFVPPADGGATSARRRAVSLRPREAARVRPASTTVAKFFAERDKFVRSMSSTGGPQDGLYAYEGFDYPPGPLSNQNGGFGWAGAWADIEAACPPGRLATNVVDAGGLPGAALRGIGGHAAQVAQQNRIRRALSTSLGGVFDSAELVENQDGHRLVGANGKTIYISFLQSVDRISDGFYGFELHRGDGNANRVLCVGNGAEGAGYGATSNFNSYGKANYARLGAEDRDTNLMVVKIEYGAENRDLVTVYRNPESLINEGVAQAIARLRGNFAFDRISFGCFDGEKRHRVDELRVGTAYRAVTGSRGRASENLSLPVAASEALLPFGGEVSGSLLLSSIQ